MESPEPGVDNQGPIAIGQEARQTPPWVWRAAAGVVAALALVPLLLYGARTESVCGGAIDARIDALRDTTGVRIVRGQVSPAGLTGVYMRDVIVRRPDDGGSLWFAVEHLEVYPDMWALVTGEIKPGRIVMDGVEVNLTTARDGGDLALLKGMRKKRAGAASKTATGGGGGGAAFLSRLPVIELKRAHIRVVDVDERFAQVVFDSREIHIHKIQEGTSLSALVTGDIQTEAYGPGELTGRWTMPAQEGSVEVRWREHRDLTIAALHHIKDPRVEGATVEAKGVALHWPMAISLIHARFSSLDQELPWTVGGKQEEGRPQLVGFEAEMLTASRSGSKLKAEARGAVAHTVLPMLGEHSVPLGHTRAVYDRETGNARVGIDFRGELGLGSATASWDRDAAHMEVTARINDVPIDHYSPLVPVKIARHFDLRQGKLSGSLVLDIKLVEGSLDAFVDLGLDHGAIRSPVLSAEDLEGVDVALRAHLTLDRETQTAVLKGGALRAGTLKVLADGKLVREGDDWTLAVDASVPRTNAQEALDGIPRAMIPMLVGARLSGEVDASLKVRIDTRDVEATVMDVQVNNDGVEVLAAGPRSPIPALAGDFELKALALPGDRTVGPGTETWVPYEEMPPLVPQAIISAEDGKFWKHSGFDMAGIHAALIKNVEARALIRGGSTISQQVVKNLFLSHNRTVSRKLQEVFLTWHMEKALSKERILEIYLNILHLGPDIYGVREAGRVLFRKIPSRLSLREAVFLGSILPNPNRFIRLYGQNNIPEDRRTKMRNILTNMMFSGFITERVRDKASRFTDQGIISIAAPPKHL